MYNVKFDLGFTVLLFYGFTVSPFYHSHKGFLKLKARSLTASHVLLKSHRKASFSIFQLAFFEGSLAPDLVYGNKEPVSLSVSW